MTNQKPLFERNLENFEALPDIIKKMHDVDDLVEARGEATIWRGTNIFSDFIAWIFRLPDAGVGIPVYVRFEKLGNGETLTRNFDSKTFKTTFQDHSKSGYIHEIFGPLWFDIEVICHAEGIDMYIRGCRLWNKIPIPLFLLPHTDATERISGGKYQFDVDISLPLIGRVIWYKGTLTIV